MRTATKSVVLLGAIAAIFALGFAPQATAKRAKEEEGIRYAKSYADAWTEARARNALIFALFHKDN